jgi:hypothetical protein
VVNSNVVTFCAYEGLALPLPVVKLHAGLGATIAATHFTHDQDVPFSVGLVVDASQSMNAALAAAQAAGATFIGGMRIHDESFLITFDSHADVAPGLYA